MDKLDKETFEKTLQSVVGSILEMAQTKREQTDAYDAMFEASLHGIRGQLDHLHDVMISSLLDFTSVLEQKTGQKVGNDLWDFLLALPYIWSRLEKDIKDKEGLTCSVDKVRHLLYEYVIANLND